MIKKRKGQYLVVEEIILFSLGLIIAFSFLAVFQVFEKEAKSQTGDEQLRILGQIVSSNILELVETNTTGKIEFSLPPSIGGNEYLLKLNSKGIFIQTKNNKTYISSVFGLENKYNLQGSVESTVKKATLSLKGEQITLEI